MKNQISIILITLLLISCSSNETTFASMNTTLLSKNMPQKEQENKNIQKLKVDGLELLCTTDNSFYFIDKPRETIYLYTEVKADFYNNSDVKRTPLNLSLVIDRSGSMSGEKLQYAKEAAIFAVKQLSPYDYISIISYGSDVTEILEPTKVENTHFIINKIMNIESSGGTNLSGGMIKGFEKVKENYHKDFLNRVFLLSDGLANEGIVNLEKLNNIVANWKEKENISLSTFGIGLGFNEDLMTDISEYGGGNYYFIDEPKNIASIFEKELNGLQSLVAKNVSMKIEYPENQLTLEKVYGYKYKEIPGTIHIDFSDLFSEEKKAILVKFSIKELNNNIEFNTIVNFTSVIKDKNTNEKLAIKTKIEATDDAKKVTKNINNFTMQQAILFESNYAMEKAAKELDAGKYDDARKTLYQNSLYISDGIDDYGNSPELDKIKEVNIQYEEEVVDYEFRDKSEQEMIQKSNKSLNYNIRKKK